MLEFKLFSINYRIKSRRKCVGPNSGFLSQLVLYENMNWVIDKENFQYKLFILDKAKTFVRKSKYLGVVDDHNLFFFKFV